MPPFKRPPVGKPKKKEYNEKSAGESAIGRANKSFAHPPAGRQYMNTVKTDRTNKQVSVYKKNAAKKKK